MSEAGGTGGSVLPLPCVPCVNVLPSALPPRASPVSTLPALSSTDAAASGQVPQRPTGCRDVKAYEKLAKLGEGTFGVVYRARDTCSGDIVALKQVKFIETWKDFPVTTLREIRALRLLRHPNVMELKEVVTSPPALAQAPAQTPSAPFGDVCLVFQYSEHTLKGLWRTHLRHLLMNVFSRLTHVQAFLRR